MNQSVLLRIFLVSAVFSGFASWELTHLAQAETLLTTLAQHQSKAWEEEDSREFGKRDRPKLPAVSSQRSPLFSTSEDENQLQLNSATPNPVILVGAQPEVSETPVATTAIALTAPPDVSPVASTDAPALAQANDSEDDEEDADFSAPPVNLEFTGEDTIRLTVTGTRTPIRINDLPATVTVFELEDFEFYQFQNLRDLLRYEPGVSVRDNAQFGIQDVNIRGLEGNRILFQVDGIRLPERFEFGPFNLGRGDYVDFATLQAVEVLRGPASTLYGSDALGGVVSYRSLEPRDLLGDDDDFAADLSTLFLSETGGFDNIGRLAFRHEDSEAVFVISRRDGREQDSFADSEFVDSLDAEGTTFYGNYVQRLSPVSQVSLLAEDFSRFTRRNEADGNLTLNLTEDEDILIDRTRVSFSYEYDDAASETFLNYARAQVFYQDAKTREILRETRASGNAFRGQAVSRETENEFIADSDGGDVQFRSDFATGDLSHRLTYGFDISNTFNSRPRDRTETNLATGVSTNVIPPDVFPVKDFPDGDTLRIGVYLQDEINIGVFDIIAGLRFDYYDLTTDPDQDFSRNGAESADLEASALSPRVAVLYQATPEISLYGQYARGFRAPLYSEINSGFTNLTGSFFKYETLSNPDLEPETSNSFEIGVRGDFPQFNFGVTGFYNTYDNFIETFVEAGERCLVEADPCPVLPPNRGGTQTVTQFQTQNVAEARIYGVEVSAEYRFSPGLDGFSVLGSLAFAEGDNTTDDEPLSTVDPLTAVLGLRYRAPNDQWRAEFLSTIVGQARVDDGAEEFCPMPTRYLT